MALVACAECNNDVSTKAAACPRCGAPVEVQAAGAEGTGAAPKSKQEQSRHLRFHVLLASLIFWGGCAGTLKFALTDRPNDLALPFYGVLFGAVWYVGAKVATWWHRD